MYDAKSAIQYIETQFPQLVPEIHDEVVDGLLHPHMGVFSRLAQHAIDESDRDQWMYVTSKFVTICTDCSPDVENALNVSFLEHLNFNDGKSNRSWAYDAMPPVMKHAWDEMEAYNRRTPRRITNGSTEAAGGYYNFGIPLPLRAVLVSSVILHVIHLILYHENL